MLNKIGRIKHIIHKAKQEVIAYNYNECFLNVDDPGSVCVCVCLFLFPLICKRFLGKYWCHHHQTWQKLQGDCLRHVLLTHHVFMLYWPWPSFKVTTDLNHENHQCSSNLHQVCCEDSLTKGLYNLFQYDDLALQSRSQLHLKLDKFLTCTIIAISWILF